jgi:hypothetical protein
MVMMTIWPGAEVVGADKENALGVWGVGVDADDRDARLDGRVDGAFEEVRVRD